MALIEALENAVVHGNCEDPHKRVFYEQVTAVKVWLLFFTFIGLLFCCCSCGSLRRMLLSIGFLFALCMSCLDAGSVPVGVREESRCCYLSVGLKGQNAHAVIGTRCHRNG
jgi:hypothetical protein